VREPSGTDADDLICPTCGAERSCTVIGGLVELTCPACHHSVTRITAA
jgi:hypothetical protein